MLSPVLRPGFIQLRVLDIDEAIVHYRDHMGLDFVSRDDGRVYFKAYDEFDRHSVVLREADNVGVDVMGFKMASQEAVEELRRNLDERGVAQHAPQLRLPRSD